METYLTSEKKEQCYGCKACEQACPNNSIEMKLDNEGFWYPNINDNTCIHCNLCIKVCPYDKQVRMDTTFDKPIVIAAINKNENERNSSSSGGIFSNLYKYIIENNGVVFGVELNKDNKVKHSIGTNKNDIERFKGSKYVQSDINICFNQAKHMLENGKLVLFTGTPCQISGLYSYLNKEYENLYTCDIVCHGTPSPKVFEDYMNYLEKKYMSKISDIKFRDKSNGWKVGTLRVNFYNNREYKVDWTKDKYYRLFFTHRILRPSCHNCKFSNIKREGDITLGDFWGIEDQVPHMFDNKGTSLVLLNSQKGINLFNNIQNSIIMKECSIEQAMQPNLKETSKPSHDRLSFFEDYNKEGFKYVLDVYTGVSFVERLKGKIRKFSRLKIK